MFSVVMAMWGRQACTSTCTGIGFYRILPLRTLSYTCFRSAGFQGSKASTSNATVLQMRIERKKKLVRKLEGAELEMKPLKDFNIRYSWKSPERQRNIEELTADELETRILLRKEWASFASRRKTQEEEKLVQLEKSQEDALYELRQESESLYHAAVQVDEDLFPFSIVGPPETPPLKNYKAPLGTSYRWEETFN